MESKPMIDTNPAKFKKLVTLLRENCSSSTSRTWTSASGGNDQAVPLVRSAAPQRLLQADQGAAEGEGRTGHADQGTDRRRAVVWLSDRGGAAGDEQEHGAADLPAEGLAGAQAGRGLSTADPGAAV